VNARNETNLTPLHWAALLGNPEPVQLLIKHGADVTAKDWNNNTPLHFALSRVSAKLRYSCSNSWLMPTGRIGEKPGENGQSLTQ
jgi:hypothetical protein